MDDLKILERQIKNDSFRDGDGYHTFGKTVTSTVPSSAEVDSLMRSNDIIVSLLLLG
jgi:hypothetical protein